jgi:NADPH-dependent glutamate synthase beta subunit-like oxidoreductase/NAD(P)H-flavin reductase
MNVSAKPVFTIPDEFRREAGIESARDLHEPEKLGALHRYFQRDFAQRDPEGYARFEAYRKATLEGGAGLGPQAESEALLAAAPHVSAFVGRLFGVEGELAKLADAVSERAPIFRFKRDFAKKRVLKADAGRAFAGDPARADALVRAAHEVVSAPGADEELAMARACLAVLEVDDVARKVAKGGGATWTPELLARGEALVEAVKRLAPDAVGAGNALDASSEASFGALAAMVLDAFEAHLARRLENEVDAVQGWVSLKSPKNLNFDKLVHIERPSASLPELFVGPIRSRREREGFALTDARKSAREVESEVDYCLYCHDRDKDSCSKGLRDSKTKELKKNPLGVTLGGCPLDEKISEMHVMRREGDSLAALALVTLDNPMCPGTGHRICNDCMKACVFQKQDPVNIPEIETRVLSEILALPWGLEIYGFLTRFNPLSVRRPHQRTYNGKKVLVVGLGPAGYTLAHHLSQEGFAVVAVDGLKIEPLPSAWTNLDEPIFDFSALQEKLDERVLLGFGGVSEYGITVRWDKNFLTLLYVTLARNANIQIFGGVRFGGTLTAEDAWQLGFDHVALAAGAGRPTIVEMKNNLARGIRKASDFLMALQLSGAYKADSIANLEVELPAVVIGGGLTAIDTATELLAYYPVQVEKLARRYEVLVAEKGAEAIRSSFDEEQWAQLSTQLEHARLLTEERRRAAAAGETPRVQSLLASWGGVTLVYRKSLADSPAYRLNHEEVEKSLEEGIFYAENLSPKEALLDRFGHVDGVRFARNDGSTVDLRARTVCVAAGTSPNITYEREHEGSFELDERKQYFRGFEAEVQDGHVTLRPSRAGIFTSYHREGRVVSFYGDNHPVYAGSVVRAMASAKDGYPKVVALFPELLTGNVAAPIAERSAFFAKLHDQLDATVVRVERLTKTIVEVVVKAPLAARKFEPGQFYRLQNFERIARVEDDTRLAMEGLALTGAWTDPEQGLLGTIVLEMGGSSRLCAALAPGEPVVLMGPTGAPTHIGKDETVLLAGGGLGNAVLFSIARAMKATGCKVIYFAGYKDGGDLYKQEEIEKHTDQVIWATDAGKPVETRRPQDRHFRGNIVQAMLAYGRGELGPFTPLKEVQRIIAIGSDRMMAAVREARHGVLLPLLSPKHLAIGSINSPMQCMMKEICAQCLQKHTLPDGKEVVVFSCFNQDQELDRVNFAHLAERLRANSMQERLTALWLDRLFARHPSVIRV